jgi:hypothetical protein
VKNNHKSKPIARFSCGIANSQGRHARLKSLPDRHVRLSHNFDIIARTMSPGCQILRGNCREMKKCIERPENTSGNI